MILVLSKSSQEKTSQFQTAIQRSHGTDAAIKNRIQETQIDIKNLDEVTTEQALRTATGDSGN